jgi:hypothetical protein
MQCSEILASSVTTILSSATDSVNPLNEKTKGEEGNKNKILNALDEMMAYIGAKDNCESVDQNNLIAFLPKLFRGQQNQKSDLYLNVLAKI